MRRDDKINLYALREREKGEKRGAEKFLSFFCSSPPLFARENIYHFNHFGKGWLISSLFLFSVFLLPVLLFLYLFSHSFLTAARCFLSCLLSASWDLGRKEAKVLSSSKLFSLSFFLSRYRRRCLFVSGCNQLPRRNIAWIELTSFPPASLFFFHFPSVHTHVQATSSLLRNRRLLSSLLDPPGQHQMFAALLIASEKYSRAGYPVPF